MTTVSRIERRFGAAAASMADAFGHYWPATKGMEQGEANVVLHIGAALQSDGFHVFSQVPEESGGRVDLFASSSTDRVAVAVEGKRLFNTIKARSLAADYRRLQRLRLASIRPHPPGYDCLAVIVATTWSEPQAEWWCRRGVGGPPSRCRSPGGWNTLAQALQEACAVGALPLGPSSHVLLYGIRVAGDWFEPGPPGQREQPAGTARVMSG